MSQENVEIVRRWWASVDAGDLPFDLTDENVRIDNISSPVSPITGESDRPRVSRVYRGPGAGSQGFVAPTWYQFPRAKASDDASGWMIVHRDRCAETGGVGRRGIELARPWRPGS
jgi:hypothetical protein